MPVGDVAYRVGGDEVEPFEAYLLLGNDRECVFSPSNHAKGMNDQGRIVIGFFKNGLQISLNVFFLFLDVLLNPSGLFE